MQITNQAATLTIPAFTSSLALRTEAQPANIPTQFAIAMMKYQQNYHFMAAATRNLESLSLSPTKEAPSPTARRLGHYRLKLKPYRKSHHAKKSQHASPPAESPVAQDIAMKDGPEEEICTGKLALVKDPVAASALAKRRQHRVAHRAHLKLAPNARKTE
ncbi:hypothetical protein BDV97DRAFT_369200 [Delphinella strobiligena]|nr:hypothetical protein BDV97DRAFT_369200 [Delphinella strobiligena]